MATKEQVYKQFGPDKLAPRILDPSPGDGKFLIISITFFMFLYVVPFPRILTLILSILFVGVGMWRFRQGRGHHLCYMWFKSLYIQYRLHDVLWDQENVKKSRFGDTLSIGGIELSEENRNYGILYDHLKRTDNLVIAHDGAKFVTRGEIERREAILELADMTRRTSSKVNFPVGLSPLVRYRPYNPTKNREYLRDNVSLSLLKAQEDLHLPYEELTPAQQFKRRQLIMLDKREKINLAHGRDCQQVTIVTVRRPRTWIKNLRNLTADDISDAPILDMATELVEDMEAAGVVRPRVLSITEVYDFFRRAHDLSNLPQYYEDQANGEIPTSDDQLEIGDDNKILTPIDYWWFKEKVTVGHDWICIDGTYHRVLQMTKMPRYFFTTTFDGLKQSGLHITFSNVTEAMSGSRERAINTRAIGISNTFSAYQGKKSYTTREERDARGMRELREDQRFESGNVIQLYDTLVVLSARSLKQLNRHHKMINAQVRRIKGGARAQAIKGRAFQRDAVLSGLLGIDMM